MQHQEALSQEVDRICPHEEEVVRDRDWFQPKEITENVIKASTKDQSWDFKERLIPDHTRSSKDSSVYLEADG